MKNAKMQVVRFDKSDVIATSGVTVSWSGAYDGTPGNATLTYKGIGYLGTTGKTLADLNTALTGTGVSINNNTTFSCIEHGFDNNQTVEGYIATGNYCSDSTYKQDYNANLYNGEFTWNGTKFIRTLN